MPLIPLALSLGLLGVAPPTQPTPPTTPSSASAFGSRTTASASSMATRDEARAALLAELLPEALTDEQLQSILARRWREASSRAVLRAAIDAYLQAGTSANELTRRPTAARFEAAYSWNGALGRFVPQPGPELTALLEGRIRWQLSLDGSERSMLSILEGVPPSEEALPLSAIRAAITGERDRRPISGALASLRLDEEITRLPIPDAATLARSELETWRLQMADALRVRRHRLDQLAIERAASLARFGPFGELGDEARRAEFDRAMVDLDAMESATESALAEINRTSLRRIQSQLPPAANEALSDRLARLLHPSIFDDERRVSVLLTRLAESEGISEESSAQLLLLLPQAQQRLRMTQASLLAAATARDDQIRALAKFAPSETPPLAPIMARLDSEIAMLKALLPRQRVVMDLGRLARGWVAPTAVEARALVEDFLAEQSSIGRGTAWQLSEALLRRTELLRPAPEVDSAPEPPINEESR